MDETWNSESKRVPPQEREQEPDFAYEDEGDQIFVQILPEIELNLVEFVLKLVNLIENEELTEDQKKRSREIISKIDSQIQDETVGRMFAVIYLNDRQFKVRLVFFE